MNEEQIVMEDLAEFLEERGIKSSSVHVDPKTGHRFPLFSMLQIGGIFYYILGSSICTSGRVQIVSLSDPKYKEKFLEKLQNPTKVSHQTT